MRNFIGLGIVVCSCVACTTPIVPQPATQSYSPNGASTAATTATVSPTCRPVNATANIDGSPQNMTGLACKQPDGTWQIQQPDAGVDVLPPYADYADDYPYYPYYDPWFYGPLAFGFGGSIVFVNHFHHFHHGDHGHYGGHGGFHGGHSFHGGGFHGGNSFPSGGGFHGGGGRR